MASMKLYIRNKDAARPDALCTKCHNPALVVYIYEEVSLDGITMIGERTACTDCKIWATTLEEYAK